MGEGVAAMDIEVAMDIEAAMDIEVAMDIEAAMDVEVADDGNSQLERSPLAKSSSIDALQETASPTFVSAFP